MDRAGLREGYQIDRRTSSFTVLDALAALGELVANAAADWNAGEWSLVDVMVVIAEERRQAASCES